MSAKSGAARVAVIIVNYNSGSMLARCLEALARQTWRDFRVIVVDNASTDGSAGTDAAAWTAVRLVRSPANLGFAAGNNLGLAEAGECEWIALLNPDAFPEPQWLERFLAGAEAHPECSFFGCCMKSADTPGVADGTGDVYHVSGLAWRRDHGVALEQARNEPGEIFGPCAAAALYRRSALDEAGGFDERFFCYFEDLDLSFRLRLLGHRCRYVPQAAVHHVGSGISGRRSDFATYHGHRNLVWTYWKNMPAPLFWLYLPLHLAMNAAAVIVCARRGQLGVILRAKRDALCGLPRILAERRRVQAARKVSSGALRAAMASGPVAVYLRGSG